MSAYLDSRQPLAQAPLAQAQLARGPLAQAPLARAPLARAPLARAPLARADPGAVDPMLREGVHNAEALAVLKMEGPAASGLRQGVRAQRKPGTGRPAASGTPSRTVSGPASRSLT